jgi:hypothetical protein
VLPLKVQRYESAHPAKRSSRLYDMLLLEVREYLDSGSSDVCYSDLSASFSIVFPILSLSSAFISSLGSIFRPL